MIPKNLLKRLRLGEILIQKKKITPEKLTELLGIQNRTSQSLGHLLVKEEIINQAELEEALSEQLGIPHVSLRKGLVDPQIVHILPKKKPSK